MNFKELYSLIHEDPDSAEFWIPNLGNREHIETSYEDEESYTFIIFKGQLFYAYSSDYWHGQMMTAIANYYLGEYDLPDDIGKIGKISDKELEAFQLRELRSGWSRGTLLREYPDVIQGRSWYGDRGGLISIWNDVKYITPEYVQLIKEFIKKVYNKDVVYLEVEGGEDSILIDTLLHKIKPEIKNNFDINTVHLAPPEKKREMLLKMGVKPKAPLDLKQRQAIMAESSMNFQELFNFIFETRFSDREYYNKHAAWKLTQDQYLKISNKGQMFHQYDSYQPRDIKVLDDDPNPPIRVEVQPNRDDPRWVDVYWELKDGTFDGKSRRSPNEVATEKDKFQFAQSWSKSEKKYKTVKDKYWFSMSDGYTIKNFPHKIQTIDGIDYRIKKEGSYKTVAAFDKDEIVGMAADEWGAYLVSVQPSHRGKGIGKHLASIYLAIYPKKDSGGYTSQGKQMAISVYKKAVQDAKKLGWYDRAIKDGTLSKEKAEKILSQI